MKRSTVLGVIGFTLFFIGAMMMQLVIEPFLFAGGVFVYIGLIIADAKIKQLEHEHHMEQLIELHKKIEASLEDMKNNLGESDEKSDDSDYFDKKRSQTDEEK